MAESDRSQIAGAAEVGRGKAYALGATYQGSGTNFALFGEVAAWVELCLFDSDGAESRVALPEVEGFVWHGFLPDMKVSSALWISRRPTVEDRWVQLLSSAGPVGASHSAARCVAGDLSSSDYLVKH